MTVFVSKSYRSFRRLAFASCCSTLFAALLATSSAVPFEAIDRGWQAEGRFTMRDQSGNQKRGHKFRIHSEQVDAILNRALTKGNSGEAGSELWLPMADGQLKRFLVRPSQVMAPELAARYPGIKTYAGVGMDHPDEMVRVDIGPAGVHAQIRNPNGSIYVDPIDTNGSEYLAYEASSALRTEDDFDCLTDPGASVSAAAPVGSSTATVGAMRTYRLAVAATGEYTQFHGGRVEDGLGAIVTAVNRLNGIYESELSIRFVLVGANDQIIYTNSSTDPYSNSDGVAMLSQNQSNLDSRIGSGNYDIGHVFSTGGGGIAQVGSVCVSGWKARGVTGRVVPLGDSFYVDYVAHEMGHQFGAHHTFNGVAGSCSSNNRHAATAYEPGSGSTIMSYSGICGADNLQYGSDAYFHSASLMEIKGFVAGTAVTLVSYANQPPTVSSGSDYTIPARTPFKLTAAGSDPDGDELFYCWEQLDLGPASTLVGQDIGVGPLFRSFTPTSQSGRYFPRLESVLFNLNETAEVLPSTSRTLHFRVTARDRSALGGLFATDDLQVVVVSNAGPFVVLSPNSSAELSGEQTVQWNVAGTDLAPISVATVNILLSTNGGYDFPIVLAGDTPNDGVEHVVLPDIYAANARIKVEAVENIFFDIGDADFAVVPQAGSSLVMLTETNAYRNPDQVLIPAAGTQGVASRYPLSIQVEGLQGSVDQVSVQLHGLSHGFVDDLDILLVGPEGQSVVLLSDSSAGAIANNLELMFNDQGARFPDTGTLGSGTYQPSNMGSTGDTFPVPGPYGSQLSMFDNSNPNGTWALYILDDSAGDSGALTGGWTLNLETRRLVEPTNAPPIILAPAVHYVHAGSTLVVTNQAVDPDNSGVLTFALRPGAPSGVVLDQSGILTWSPSVAYVGSTNRCTLSVTDSGAPAMTSEAEVDVIVVGGPVMHPLQIINGTVVLGWDSIPGSRYQVESTTDLDSGDWVDAGSSVSAVGFNAELTIPAEPGEKRFFRVRVDL